MLTLLDGINALFAELNDLSCYQHFKLNLQAGCVKDMPPFPYLSNLIRMLRLEDSFNAMKSFLGIELIPLSSYKLKEIKAHCRITGELIAAKVGLPEADTILLFTYNQNDTISLKSIPNTYFGVPVVPVTLVGMLPEGNEFESRSSMVKSLRPILLRFAGQS